MANVTLNTRLVIKNDTATNWSNNNPVLLKGEIGFEMGTEIKFKVGDGTTAWNSLEYFEAGLKVLSGASAPTSTTAGKTGQLYYSSGNGKMYMCYSESPYSWKQVITPEDLSALGAGDMLKATYDTNDNGIVDNAEAVNGKTVNDTAAASTNTLYTSKKIDDTYVAKENGKGLSTNDYTTADMQKLAGIEQGAQANVQSDWNESDASEDSFIKNKPSIPTATSDLTNDSNFVTSTDLSSDYMSKAGYALSGSSDTVNKADKDADGNVISATYVKAVSGKGLSTNDYTTADMSKLAGIAAGAEVNVQSDWNVTDTTSDAYIANKPTALPADGGNADTVDGKHVDDTQTTSGYLWTAEKTKAYADSIASSVDAMTFKGVVNSNSDLPSTGVKKGDTYRVGTAGTYAGEQCEVGDMIIATNTTPTWAIIQANIDGAVVSSSASSTDGVIAVFDGTSGRTIKVGTKTISQLEYTLPVADSSTLGGVKISSSSSDKRVVHMNNSNELVVDNEVLIQSDTYILDCGNSVIT